MGYQIHYPGAEPVSQKKIRQKKKSWMRRAWFLGLLLGLLLLPYSRAGCEQLYTALSKESNMLIPVIEIFSKDLQSGKNIHEAIKNSLQGLNHEGASLP